MNPSHRPQVMGNSFRPIAELRSEQFLFRHEAQNRQGHKAWETSANNTVQKLLPMQKLALVIQQA